MMIERAGATGDTMSDDKAQSSENDRPEQAKPQSVDQEAQQSRTSATAPPVERTAPGRTPLFRR
jgi:hypothetical protein